MHYMFGIPYYLSKIDATSYNKADILKDITENYNRDPSRNKWDNVSNLHHSYGDKENENFIKINYEQLLPLYTQHISNFLNTYSDIQISFRYDVENYTCMSKGQFMREHDHPHSDFSAVHYIKFNPDLHRSTNYINPAPWTKYTDRVASKVMGKIVNDSRDLKHSWFWEDVNFNIQEDDFVITPSLLKHSVPMQLFDELRVVIVLNIHLTE